ncbi:MAG: copper-translocating P-type ATPase CopA1 [Bacteroidia bacterium]
MPTTTQPQHIELNVQGMTCTNCALGVEKYLRQAGMEQVSVDFSSGEVVFELLGQQELPRIIKGIEGLGYKVIKDGETGNGSHIERYFWFCLVFTLPLLLHMFIPWRWLHQPYVQLALATPVYLLGMYHFGCSALHSLRAGVPNMDVLIAIGATAAYGYSLYGTLLDLGPDFLFYETAAGIITLVLLGNMIEHRSVQRTTSAVRDLMQLQATRVLRIRPDIGQTEEVPIQQVRPGDLLLVNEGDRLPVDGHIAGGEGEVDESMLTGETLPRAVAVHDKVIGGTLLVSGSLHVEATAIGKGSVLAQIIDLVKKAQADKPAIQQLADRISAIFVPVVLVISLLTLLLSYLVFDLPIQDAIIHSVAVLVIACPCAMGLATPTAVVVGIGRASRQGILVKGGRTLELFGGVQRVVFDKTGTLTTGAFALRAIHCPAGDEARVRQVLYSLEQHSSHPIARALRQALAGTSLLPWQQVQEVKGIGMAATDREGVSYRLGSYRIAADLTTDDSHSLYLLRDGQLWATVDLADEVRADARAAIDYLHAQGIETVLLSGDRQAACEQVARDLGIGRVYAEQLPEQKLALIEQFAREKRTAMVGDGINDAPALARAQVGISLSQATEVAMQSAQVILLNGHLGLLAELHRISRHTVLTIRQNLFWAFFYNTLAIPLAAFGLLRPVIGALTMALSDVIVIGNSLRLKVKRI